MVECVATLIARPEQGSHLAALAEAAAREFSGELDWLGPGEAVDLHLRAEDPDLLRQELADRAKNLPIDIVVQGAGRRQKRLFVADMDSTMIGQECIDELADMVGLKPRISAITERAMRGEIAFEPALRERVALLAGLTLTAVEEVIATRIRPTSGAATLIATMRHAGAYTALVSGGFTVFTDRVAQALCFDENRANRLFISEGALSGTVAEPILGQDAKLAALKELRARLRLSEDETMAVGDGANDLMMLRDAGIGVAYHAKPKVAAEAAARIDHADLTALLYIQGYRREAFLIRPDPRI